MPIYTDLPGSAVRFLHSFDIVMNELSMFNRLRNSQNEELALLFSQFWLLGLSFAAVSCYGSQSQYLM